MFSLFSGFFSQFGFFFIINLVFQFVLGLLGFQ